MALFGPESLTITASGDSSHPNKKQTMASSTSGANFVEYFFYKESGYTRAAKTSLVALAYATARDLEIAPSAVLIRFVMPMVPDCDLQITPPCYHGQRRPRAND
jgi:hypothetical protein